MFVKARLVIEICLNIRTTLVIELRYLIIVQVRHLATADGIDEILARAREARDFRGAILIGTILRQCRREFVLRGDVTDALVQPEIKRYLG